MLEGMEPLSWLKSRYLHATGDQLREPRMRKSRKASGAGTHRYWRAVRLPRLDGIVPLSWLDSNELRTQTG